jgi:hypothetical protein
VSALLPAEFAELEQFAERWCLPTETERFERRMTSDMDDMGAFYAAFSPRLEEAIEFCGKYPLDELPEDVNRLLQLIHSFVMVSMAVEIFHQPKIVDAADAVLLRVKEPRP